MDRRIFIQAGLAAAGASLLIPGRAGAGLQNMMAGGVYHTAEAPGRWSKKVSSHLPSLAVERTPQGVSVEVVTRHTMDQYDHYIVKHMLLDANYRFIAENMFDPLKIRDPVSVFELGQYNGTLFALSVCNRHDTWLNVTEV